MKTREIAPGSLLQRLYIAERLRKHRNTVQEFYELGSGNGYNARLLLESGLTGMSIDMNESACEKNRMLNKSFIDANMYDVQCGDFFGYEPEHKADLLFSCMVVEHLPEELEAAYFEKAKQLVKPGGLLITMVPGSMKHWGIEDEIAGHRKRYTAADMQALANKHGLKLEHVAGLTYPVSNWLLPLSNRIIRKKEQHKLALSAQEQTVLSGNREVLFKTDYPWWMQVMLNDVTMYPFHLLQKAFRKNPNALILYSEMRIL